jgi:1-acyl-sn-glycerol-3-phosphate acyltransferase
MAKKQVEAVREENSILYSIGRGMTQVVCHTVMPVSIHHRERLDREAPFLMIANHQHALDPIPMAMAVRGRQVVFLGKKELAKNKLLRNLLTRVHCILVDRHHTDMEAMRACMKAIKMKKILLIFPEGTRHHEGQMEQIENGTALIALRSRCPIIPMYFDRKLRLFRRTHLYVGEPIPCDDLLEAGINTETCEKMNERFRETYREMVREYGHFE